MTQPDPALSAADAAKASGLGYVDIAEINPDGGALSRLDASQARRLNVLPFAWTSGGALKVAVAPASARNLMLRDDLARSTRSKVEFVVADAQALAVKIAQEYSADEELSDLAAVAAGDNPAAATPAASTDLGLATGTEDAPVIRFVNLLIERAILDGASDIHIEPGENDLVVRYRIDGVLHDAHTAPKRMIAEVISRLKIMAEINIGERRIPQDGRMSVVHHGRKIDLRVNTLPTVWGEKVVMRLLDNSAAALALADIGFSPQNLAAFGGAYKKPHGLILVTGPTGSGKSTTLYSTLNEVATRSRNTITVEDPVEYRIPRITQVQVNNKAGLTFPVALRAILRQDPDILLVGEIRDKETAQIAVEASLTGHLVFSTLHTNDAPAAVVRLIEMGVEPFLVGSALEAVLAQRLCRRLCSRCKQAYTPDPAELLDLGYPMQSGTLPTLYRPVGCEHCARTGFRGRLAVHEVMVVGEEIERLAVARSSTDDVRRSAVADGMSLLRDDGWRKVAAGDTSIEEILRVVA